MIVLRNRARILLLTGLLAAPSLALAEGTPAPKPGESAGAKDEKKPAAKAHKKGAKDAEKDKGGAPQH